MTSKIVTEGDKILKANIARELFNVDGTGIKVGIISTSFNAEKKLKDDVISGDLPGEKNPDGKTTRREYGSEVTPRVLKPGWKSDSCRFICLDAQCLS